MSARAGGGGDRSGGTWACAAEHDRVGASREAWSALPDMRAALHRPRPYEQVSLAEGLLGAYDPLVGALRRHSVGCMQFSVTAAVLAASAGLVAVIGAAVIPLVLASGVVTVVLGVRLALRTLELRDAALGVIVAGRGEVEVPVVRRECERLSDHRRRGQLARSYLSLGAEPDMSGRTACRACVVVVPGVIAEVRGELAVVAELLRRPGPAVRGVAAAHRLLVAGGSPLYGRDPELLRQELRRVSFLLRTCGTDG